MQDKQTYYNQKVHAIYDEVAQRDFKTAETLLLDLLTELLKNNPQKPKEANFEYGLVDFLFFYYDKQLKSFETLKEEVFENFPLNAHLLSGTVNPTDINTILFQMFLYLDFNAPYDGLQQKLLNAIEKYKKGKNIGLGKHEFEYYFTDNSRTSGRLTVRINNSETHILSF